MTVCDLEMKILRERERVYKLVKMIWNNLE